MKQKSFVAQSGKHHFSGKFMFVEQSSRMASDSYYKYPFYPFCVSHLSSTPSTANLNKL